MYGYNCMNNKVKFIDKFFFWESERERDREGEIN